MERQFDFLMPSVNFFGPGVIAKIGERAKMLNMTKVLVVTEKGLTKLANGPVAQTLASLEAAGLTTWSLMGWNQTEDSQHQSRKELYLAQGCDSIITVGGAPPMTVGRGSGLF